jgi:hypothetical protein
LRPAKVSGSYWSAFFSRVAPNWSSRKSAPRWIDRPISSSLMRAAGLPFGTSGRALAKAACGCAGVAGCVVGFVELVCGAASVSGTGSGAAAATGRGGGLFCGGGRVAGGSSEKIEGRSLVRCVAGAIDRCIGGGAG